MAANTSPLPPPSPSKVNKQTIQKAVNALLKRKQTQTNSQTPQLLPEEDFMYLVLTLKKIPPKFGTGSHKNPQKIPLLHHDSSSELCLIIDDRPNSKLTSDLVKKKVNSENIPITKIVKISKLKSDYQSFEAKRKLCDSYDLFFADKRVVPHLPKILGKGFFKKKKLPLSVDLTHNNWKEQIERACSSALLHLKSNGTCSVVRVGRVEMGEEEIAENVGAAIDGVVEFVPKKWKGVRSLHLKFSESVALPIYQAVDDIKLKIEGFKENVVGKMVVTEDIKKDDKLLGRKRGNEKARIREVWYMDDTLGDVEVGSDNDGSDGEDEKSENDDLGSAEILNKKRKNGETLAKKISKVKKPPAV